MSTIQWEPKLSEARVEYAVTGAPDVAVKYSRGLVIRPDLVDVVTRPDGWARAVVAGPNVKADGTPGKNRHDTSFFIGGYKSEPPPSWVADLIAEQIARITFGGAAMSAPEPSADSPAGEIPPGVVPVRTVIEQLNTVTHAAIKHLYPDRGSLASTAVVTAADNLFALGAAPDSPEFLDALRRLFDAVKRRRGEGIVTDHAEQLRQNEVFFTDAGGAA